MDKNIINRTSEGGLEVRHCKMTYYLTVLFLKCTLTGMENYKAQISFNRTKLAVEIKILKHNHIWTNEV